MGMTIRSARNAIEGRRSANGRNPSMRVRNFSSFSSGPRSLHLAGTARRSVRTPAFRVCFCDRLLHKDRLLAQYCVDRLVLDDDADEGVGNRLVEIIALRAQSDRQGNDLGIL